MIFDPPDPAELPRVRLQQLAGKQDDPEVLRRSRAARQALDARPRGRQRFELRGWTQRQREGRR